ncbi:MAG: dTMP kinase [Gammaproteobacteria bacterium]|nr:MAG: dTMP kinase [Gammaproteobacteria bacterium]
MARGFFLTLEGGEGAGKSTNLRFVQSCLEAAGKPVLMTREPGGTALGEALRAVLLDANQSPVDPLAELLMMFAARAQHVEDVIKPALAEGYWVVCDRFTDATYAYQGGGRGLPRDTIATLETMVQGDLRPDLTILLDLPVAVGMQRAGARDAAPDRIEQESQDFFERVRAAYRERAQQFPQRYCVVDASQDLPAVQSGIRAALETVMAKRS